MKHGDFFERPTLEFFSKKSGFDGLTNRFYAALTHKPISINSRSQQRWDTVPFGFIKHGWKKVISQCQIMYGYK
jgi:hypothetical protein